MDDRRSPWRWTTGGGTPARSRESTARISGCVEQFRRILKADQKTAVCDGGEKTSPHLTSAGRMESPAPPPDLCCSPPGCEREQTHGMCGLLKDRRAEHDLTLLLLGSRNQGKHFPPQQFDDQRPKLSIGCDRSSTILLTLPFEIGGLQTQH